MDHDREVNSLIAQSKSAFLQELGREFRERQKQYNLDEEFAKTKKNRSVLVPIVVAGITILLLGAAFIVSTTIQSRSSDLDIGMATAFSDVNLRDVLDTVKRNETEMERAQERLREILNARDRRLQSAESAAQREITLLNSRGLTQAQIDREAAAIRNGLGVEVAAIDQEFAPQIEEAENLIAEIQARIDQYDSRQLEQAQAQQEVLNNQQRLFELEMAQLREQYESEIAELSTSHANQVAELEAFQVELERSLTQRFTREREAALAAQFDVYNPTFTGSALTAMLNAGPAPGQGPNLTQVPTTSTAARPHLGSQSIQSLANIYAAAETLLARIEAVPYENSVPRGLSTLRSQIGQAAQAQIGLQNQLAGAIEDLQEENWTLEDELTELQQVSRDAALLDQLLDQVDAGLSALARANGDFGYVLDPRDQENVLIYATDPELLDVGMEGLIFREDSRLIGRIAITRLGRPLLGRIVSLQDGEQPSPYDSLVFALQGNSLNGQSGNTGEDEPSPTESQSSEVPPVQAVVPSGSQEQGEDNETE